MAVIEATNENFDELIREKDVRDGWIFTGTIAAQCVFTAPCLRDVADDLAEIQFVKVNTSTCRSWQSGSTSRDCPPFSTFIRASRCREMTAVWTET